MAIATNFQIKNGITVGVGGSILVSSGNSVGIGTTTPSSALQVIGTVTGTTFSGSGSLLTSIPNSALNNSSVTINTGTGLTGGGSVSLGGSLTLASTGVTSVAAGSGINVSGSTGAVTISNTGVTSLATSGIGISVSGSTGAVTISSGATSINTANTIVSRDASGNFTAGTITGTTFSSSTGSAGSPSITFTGNTNTGIFSPSSNIVAVSTNGTEALRVDASGNLGIGTASPGAKVEISGTGTQTLKITTNTSGNPTVLLSAAGLDGASILYDRTNNCLRTDISGVTGALYLNTSGNLGLGVVPSAWVSGYKVLQLGATSVLNFGGGSGLTAYNTYFNGTNYIYQNNAPAGRFGYNWSSAGGFDWQIAPSGTAGNAITFTQAMTLDATGKLGIGTASPTQTLHVVGNSRITGSQYDSNNVAGTTGQYLQSTGTGTSWSTVIAGITITDDTSTNATRYLTFTSATSGTITTENTSSTKLSFNPSTGNLNAGGSLYSGSAFVGTATTITQNYTVTTSYNEMSVGPVTVQNGITVTVNSGAQWTVV